MFLNDAPKIFTKSCLSNYQIGIVMIERLNSRVIHEGIIKVRLDKVKLPNGKEDEYTVLEYPKSVGIVPLFENGSMLLIRQYRHALGRYVFELAGGIVDDGEDSKTTAFRELEEETGYKAGKMRYLLTTNPDTCLSTQEVDVFLATGLTKTEQRLEDKEQIEAVHVGFDEALSMVWDGQITNGDSVAGILATSVLMTKEIL